MKKIFLFIISVYFYNTSLACLNGESKILKEGTFLYEDYKGNIPRGHVFINQDGYKKAIIKLDSFYYATKDLDYLSDKGLLLIILKQYDKAIKLYLEIEKIEPNRYSTASNIGTVYELIGQNENALKWINKAIKIDPSSHNNSEWIHANILQAKLQGDSLINSTFLINTSFTREYKDIGFIPETNLSESELKILADALYYQLNERVSFIKYKDKIISKLMFYLGDISFLQKKYFDAMVIYSFARDYADEKFHKQIDDRIQYVASNISYELQSFNLNKNTISNTEGNHAKLEKIYTQELKIKTTIIYILITVIILLVLTLIYFKRKNRSKIELS